MARKERPPAWYEFEQAPRKGSIHVVAEGSPHVALCGCAVDATLETKWKNIAAAMPVDNKLLMELGDHANRAQRHPVSKWATCKRCISAYEKL